jgi:hypothetical protein
MIYLYAGLIGFGSTYALWIFYLAVMNLKIAREANLLTTTAKVLGYPLQL